MVQHLMILWCKKEETNHLNHKLKSLKTMKTIAQYVTRPRGHRSQYPSLGNALNEFLNTATGEAVHTPERKYKSFTNPATNVIVYDDKYTIELALPGFSKESVQITCDDHLLTVKAEDNSDAPKSNYRLREFNYSGFSKSFTIPESVDTEAIQANFKDGILTIVLNKKAEATPPPPKKIEIE